MTCHWTVLSERAWWSTTCTTLSLRAASLSANWLWSTNTTLCTRGHGTCSTVTQWLTDKWMRVGEIGGSGSLFGGHLLFVFYSSFLGFYRCAFIFYRCFFRFCSSFFCFFYRGFQNFDYLFLSKYRKIRRSPHSIGCWWRNSSAWLPFNYCSNLIGCWDHVTRSDTLHISCWRWCILHYQSDWLLVKLFIFGWLLFESDWLQLKLDWLMLANRIWLAN